MADGTDPARARTSLETKSRQLLTFLIISLSVVGVIFISAVVLFIADGPNRLDTAKFVFGATLPLLASWVGTILAYYFAKENFTAATQSVSDMAARVTMGERLKSIPVREKMRPFEEIKHLPVAPGAEEAVKLADVLTQFPKSERLVFLSPQKCLRYLIHKSVVERYLSALALDSERLPAGKGVKDVTLRDLLADAKSKDLFVNLYAFVKPNQTLADAKTAMDSIPRCGDVFVTENGRSDEPIVGWITDNRILESATV
jgi:hypothetical protein